MRKGLASTLGTQLNVRKHDVLRHKDRAKQMLYNSPARHQRLKIVTLPLPSLDGFSSQKIVGHP